jgi:DNA processing protein
MTDALMQLAFGALSPKRVDSLLATYGSPAAALRAVTSGRTSLSEAAVAQIVVPASERREGLRALGVTWLARDSAAYPERLRRFDDAPRWLFVRGKFLEEPCIAVVGTRRCTPYGIELAAAYGAVAARSGWVVASGLAKGIDHAAQSGAVDLGGVCHTVLGSGIDVVYPRRHRPLYEAIIAGGGAMCSEFPPGTRPDAWRFPTRNRVIAGMADVVLVVEAGLTGGALITARIALEYGVPVFASPGDVDRPASAGTNELIRDGAFPVFDGDDLAQVLDLISPLATGAAGAA